MSARPGAYPLAARREHWPAAARGFFEERIALVLEGCRCTDAESEAAADAITRRWWRAGGDDAFLRRT